MFDLAMLKRLYTEARDNTDTSRRESELAQDYYDNKQWTSDQIKVLRKRKQPEIWVNRIAPAVNGILGVLEQGQADPRAYPRNEEDQDASEIATDSLRYASDVSRWPRTKLRAAKNYLISGVAAVVVEVNREGDPFPRVIRHGEFLYDPHSRDPDFEDARFMGVAKWMYVDQVRAMYPDAQVDPDSVSPSSISFDDEDKPVIGWTDPKRNRILIVEMYIDKGGWKKVCFYGGGVLDARVSEYHDERGVPTNPIVAQSCFVDRDNGRYGIVKAMIPIQDEINMSRSRALHMLNSRRLMITDANAVDVSHDIAREEAAKPDGVIPEGFAPADNADLTQGQFQRMQEAKAELERMGPNPAVLGQSNASASGRAQLVRQQAGLTELTPVLGGIEDLELRVYRQMWARIKQFWNEPKTVRVTDDIGAAKFLMVNEPVTQEVQAIVMGPDGQPTVGTQQVVVEVKNRPAEMDMDIIIDAVADTANVQQEQFNELVKLAQVYGPQEVPFDDILEVSNLPKKRELIEKRQNRAQEAQAAQAPDPRIEADVAVKQSQAAVNAAKADGMALENRMNAIGAAQLVNAVPEIDNAIAAAG